jgi:4-hydroxy-tetrahydrodipicolinate synthase
MIPEGDWKTTTKTKIEREGASDTKTKETVKGDSSAPHFRVLSGDDSLTFAMIALGADGLISVAANEAPGLVSRMVELALAGKWDEARELHFRLLPLMEVNFIESSPGPVKAALAMMGLIEESYRLPLVPIQHQSRARLSQVLSELGLLNRSVRAAGSN